MKKLASVIAILLFAMFIAPTDVWAGDTGDKQQFCNAYADKAVAQFNLGKQHNLPGIVPPVWSNDRNGHYNWCMQVPENVANSENAKRQAYLNKYIKHETPQEGMQTGAVSKGVLNMPDMGKILAVTQNMKTQSYLGCFKDQKNRDISGFSFNAPNMTKELCMAKCQQKGFQYAGLQYGRYCFCGNSYGKLGKADNCNMPCAGNKAEICGGSWANSVYRVNSTTGKAVEKFKTKVLGNIEKTDLISMDNNVMHIRLYYRVDASVANSLYAGAFLYDINLKAINAGYEPTKEHRSPGGSIDIYLVLPPEPFQSATLETFLIHSGGVLTKRYFKVPFVWDGQHGRIVAPSVISNGSSPGQTAQMESRQKQEGLFPSQIKHLTRINQNLKHGVPVGLDPGLGP